MQLVIGWIPAWLSLHGGGLGAIRTHRGADYLMCLDVSLSSLVFRMSQHTTNGSLMVPTQIKMSLRDPVFVTIP